MNPHGRIRACGRSRPNPANPSLKNISAEEAWNHEYYRKLRLDMLAGRQNPNCEKCYIEERLGAKSRRHAAHEEQSHLTKGLAAKITDSEGRVKIPPSHIDLRVGNICNLKCVHCWTGNSSKWYEDKPLLDKYENTKYLKISNHWVSEKGDIWRHIRENIKSIRRISFLGGEPFAAPAHGRLLDWLIANNHRHLSLGYVSNGTLLTEDVIRKLSKMRQVSLGLSLDGIHKRAEYMRAPFLWSRMEGILLMLNRLLGGELQPRFRAFFNWTAYSLNIFSLPETYRYCQRLFPRIDFCLGDLVERPRHMSVQNLPARFKQKTAKKLQGLKIPNIDLYLNYMLEGDLWGECGGTLRAYLNDLDRVRGTDWKKTFPEMAGFWPAA